MKRAPHPGEPRLVHTTTNTGDQAAFALAPENFDPAILDALALTLPDLPGPPGWRIELQQADAGTAAFRVFAGALAVSMSRARQSGDDVELVTMLEPHAALLDPDDAGLLADLEQCVALALLRHGASLSRTAPVN